MGKKILLLIFSLFTQICLSQNIYPSTGNVGIGITSPSVKLHINNGNNSYGAILANSDEFPFALYTKTLSTQPVLVESFRLGMKFNDNENNGFISFYRGNGSDGGFLGFSTYGEERVRISYTGNVGIGTNTPVSKLSIAGSLTLNGGLTNWVERPSVSVGTLSSGEIRGISNAGNGADDGFLRLSSGGGTNWNTKSFIDLSGYSTIPDMNRNIVFGTTGSERMRIDMDGNIGIGTTSPQAKLDVSGTIQINGGANSFAGFGQASASKPIDVRSGTHYPYVFNWHEGLTFSAHSAYGGIRFYNQGYPDMYGGGVLVMSITNNNVGIGSSNPDSKLTVKGKIHAEEVKIDLAVPADYVFEKYYLGESSLKPDYTLLTLSEVEKFTEENHHLPNVPSVKEIKENGFLVGEMSNVLLQKIEELTLYSIEQSKEIQKLKKENESFKKLEERLSKIESELKVIK